MNILTWLLDLDLSLLQSARGLVAPEHAQFIQITGELVVIFGAFLLIGIWLYGVYYKNNEYKKIALSIFFTIVIVFIIYAIINLGIPKWRLGAMEIPGAITPLIPHPADNSFPSGHALFTGALIFGLFGYLRNKWLIILTCMIGIITLTARVVGGVHYPGDIIGGLIISLTVAHVCRPIIALGTKKLAPVFIQIASWIHL